MGGGRLDKNPDSGLWRVLLYGDIGTEYEREVLYESRDFDSKREARRWAYERGHMLENVTSSQRDK